MKKEKLILSLVATVFGLLVAGGAFYLFQTTKTVDPTSIKTAVNSTTPSPTPIPSIFLTVDKPKDEEVISSKLLTISGKTTKDAVVIIISDAFEQVVTPSSTGDFSITETIDEDKNIIEIIAVAPNGESVKVIKTVTYSQEEF